MKGKIVYGKVTEYYIDGREVTEEEFRKAFPPRPIALGVSMHTSQTAFNRPSDALAVHPDQVQEAYDDAAKKGVRTDFLKDGRPIMRDRAHQAAYLKAYGFHNKDGGYGD